MSKFDWMNRLKLMSLLWYMAFFQIGNAEEIGRASRLVSDVKQIMRGEGRYGELSIRHIRLFVGPRIAQLINMESAEGVAGLIEIILDPDFIEFDRNYGRDEGGSYPKLMPNDPHVGLMVKAVWELQKQPLVDEPAIPSVMLDKSRRRRLYGAYVLDPEALVSDCSAWCREVQAGRMSFQMEGSPSRYNRFGKAVSDVGSLKRVRGPRERKPEPEVVTESDEEKPSLWIYALLGLVIAAGLGVVLRGKLGFGRTA